MPFTMNHARSRRISTDGATDDVRSQTSMDKVFGFGEDADVHQNGSLCAQVSERNAGAIQQAYHA